MNGGSIQHHIVFSYKMNFMTQLLDRQNHIGHGDVHALIYSSGLLEQW
jgi:hypothetical protein